MHRIGVFVCWCGSNIAGTVDVHRVAEALKNGAATAIKVAMPSFDLSYEDYENIKRQVDEALDKAFRPKPEKLN